MVETTAIALISWLHDAEFTLPVEKALKYLSSCCKNVFYCSTQATVLTLKAIDLYDQHRSSATAEGSVVVRVNGREVTSCGFDKTTVGTIEAPSFASEMGPGEWNIDVEMIGGARMPYSVTINYYSIKGYSNPECLVHLETSLSKKSIKEGEQSEVIVQVENKSNDVIPMTIAIIGVPGGLEVRHEKLQELVKSGTVAFYETKGREVVLYWRSFSAKEKKSINLDVVAAVPGKYTGPASRSYLYYTNEHKNWNNGLEVEIVPK